PKIRRVATLGGPWRLVLWGGGWCRLFDDVSKTVKIPCRRRSMQSNEPANQREQVLIFAFLPIATLACWKLKSPWPVFYAPR
ncbi:MAG TPA: hypothetical protein VE131_09885, partial [Terriglobales bacterium]|nr:hypothetical protein [Terriglobales bacterium]